MVCCPPSSSLTGSFFKYEKREGKDIKQELSHVWLFTTPWSLPDSSVHWISQARILEWVAIPFSRESSWPRDQTQVSSIADRFFIIWAAREAHRSVTLGKLQGLRVVIILKQFTKTTKWLFLLFIYCCILPWWMKSSLSLKFLLLFCYYARRCEQLLIGVNYWWVLPHTMSKEENDKVFHSPHSFHFTHLCYFFLASMGMEMFKCKEINVKC